MWKSISSAVVLYLASIYCESQKNLCPVQTNDGEFDFIFLLYLFSKFATGIWRWRIRCLMEVLLVGLRFVTLVIRRYRKSCWALYKIVFKPNYCLCFSVSFAVGVDDFMSIFAVLVTAFSTKINCWNTCLHCSRGVISERIWWQGILMTI